MMSITTWLLATEHTNQHKHMSVQIQKPVGNYFDDSEKTFVLKIQESGL